jgi:hypothetical protein
MTDAVPDLMTVLRDRLIALRDSLCQRLAAADTLDAELLAMLANAETVLRALDAESAR